MIAAPGHPTKVRLDVNDPPKGDNCGDWPKTAGGEAHPNWGTLRHTRASARRICQPSADAPRPG